MDASVIVEDPSAIDDEKVGWSNLVQKYSSRSSPLAYFASVAHHMGLEATNVEFRPSVLRPYFVIAINEIKNSADTIIEEIKGYDDGPIANKYYKEVIKRHKESRVYYQQLFDLMAKKPRFFGLIKNLVRCDIEVPQEVEKAVLQPYEQHAFQLLSPKEKVSRLLTRFHSELVNARLIHAILDHQRRHDHTIVWSGGWHIDGILHTLYKLGYSFRETLWVRVEDPCALGSYLQKICPEYNQDKELPSELVDHLFKNRKISERDCLLKIASFLSGGIIVGCFIALLSACCGS